MKLPTYTSEVRLPGVANAVRGEPTGGPGAGLYKAGQGLQNFGEDWLRFGEHQTKARQVADLARLEVDATKELAELEFKLDRDPDFRGAPAKYEEAAKAIREKYSGSTEDGVVKRMFGTSFDKMSIARGISVKANAFRREADENVAFLDEAGSQYAHAIAGTQDPLLKTQLLAQHTSHIRGMAAAGWITQEAAGKRERGLHAKVEESTLNRLGLTDPQAAADAAMDDKRFPNLDEKRRPEIARTFQVRADAIQRERIANGEREERRGERQLKQDREVEEARFMARMDRQEPISEAELTHALDRQKISNDGYRMLTARLQQKAEGKDNPAVETDLVTSMEVDGDDIHGAVVRARNNGQLSGTTAQRLITRNQERLVAGKKEDFKTADEKNEFQFLSRSLGSDKLAFSYDNDTAQRLALAQREYRERVDQGKEPPKAIADDIVAKYQRNVVLPPVGYVGDTPTDTRDGITSAGNRLRALRDAGRITPDAYEREMRTLKLHADRLSPIVPAGAPR